MCPLYRQLISAAVSSPVFHILGSDGDNCHVGPLRRVVCQFHICPCEAVCSAVRRFCAVANIRLDGLYPGCLDLDRFALNFGLICFLLRVECRTQCSHTAVTVLHRQLDKTYRAVDRNAVNIAIRFRQIRCALSQGTYQELRNVFCSNRDVVQAKRILRCSQWVRRVEFLGLNRYTRGIYYRRVIQQKLEIHSRLYRLRTGGQVNRSGTGTACDVHTVRRGIRVKRNHGIIRLTGRPLHCKAEIRQPHVISQLAGYILFHSGSIDIATSNFFSFQVYRNINTTRNRLMARFVHIGQPKHNMR